jgi:hypothetical protein
MSKDHLMHPAMMVGSRYTNGHRSRTQLQILQAKRSQVLDLALVQHHLLSALRAYSQMMIYVYSTTE